MAVFFFRYTEYRTLSRTARALRGFVLKIVGGGVVLVTGPLKILEGTQDEAGGRGSRYHNTKGYLKEITTRPSSTVS
ncbi:hypothetical protein HBI56_182380 [Parastagonospora nodorum]|uniref:Uncharacterized protein n=1 Tax=Phaeosphaeria nodorum (strain SN15 / ATCC MYA-4574 / FGSC 10173) TaxID=321614 RepID=A0A7U2FDG7_PHANO|nr:hypothetical protein HBH56_187790 [Parastagonospora nodorum]QRD00941.1 hypothetical protein JI435_416050 [Parastagonospora nodorum SN15]KAH3925324.1 hypothetical protein HBH54_180780 [Parastagonospora nodorum]KAH3952881.1 hypothetical protein HBH53_035240 [Parastagonospora nodorum]KAH3959156.1 hypothetical protein HBH52_246310 [Parastagonospora nodorum]